MFRYDFVKGLIDAGESLPFRNEIMCVCLNRDCEILMISRAALAPDKLNRS